MSEEQMSIEVRGHHLYITLLALVDLPLQRWSTCTWTACILILMGQMHNATGSISPRRTKTTFFHKLKMKLCHYIHREIFFFYSGMGKGRIKIVVRDSNIMTKWANVFWHDRRLQADWIRWYKLHLTLALDGVSSIRLEGISHCCDIFFLGDT